MPERVKAKIAPGSMPRRRGTVHDHRKLEDTPHDKLADASQLAGTRANTSNKKQPVAKSTPLPTRTLDTWIVRNSPTPNDEERSRSPLRSLSPATSSKKSSTHLPVKRSRGRPRKSDKSRAVAAIVDLESTPSSKNNDESPERTMKVISTGIEGISRVVPVDITPTSDKTDAFEDFAREDVTQGTSHNESRASSTRPRHTAIRKLAPENDGNDEDQHCGKGSDGSSCGAEARKNGRRGKQKAACTPAGKAMVKGMNTFTRKGVPSPLTPTEEVNFTVPSQANYPIPEGDEEDGVMDDLAAQVGSSASGVKAGAHSGAHSGGKVVNVDQMCSASGTATPHSEGDSLAMRHRRLAATAKAATEVRRSRRASRGADAPLVKLSRSLVSQEDTVASDGEVKLVDLRAAGQLAEKTVLMSHTTIGSSGSDRGDGDHERKNTTASGSNMPVTDEDQGREVKIGTVDVAALGVERKRGGRGRRSNEVRNYLQPSCPARTSDTCAHSGGKPTRGTARARSTPPISNADMGTTAEAEKSASSSRNARQSSRAAGVRRSTRTQGRQSKKGSVSESISSDAGLTESSTETASEVSEISSSIKRGRSLANTDVPTKEDCAGGHSRDRKRSSRESYVVSGKEVPKRARVREQKQDGAKRAQPDANSKGKKRRRSNGSDVTDVTSTKRSASVTRSPRLPPPPPTPVLNDRILSRIQLLVAAGGHGWGPPPPPPSPPVTPVSVPDAKVSEPSTEPEHPPVDPSLDMEPEGVVAEEATVMVEDGGHTDAETASEQPAPAAEMSGSDPSISTKLAILPSSSTTAGGGVMEVVGPEVSSGDDSIAELAASPAEKSVKQSSTQEVAMPSQGGDDDHQSATEEQAVTPAVSTVSEEEEPVRIPDRDVEEYVMVGDVMKLRCKHCWARFARAGCSSARCFDCCVKAGRDCKAHAKQLERKRIEDELLAGGRTPGQRSGERRLAKGVFKEESIHEIGDTATIWCFMDFVLGKSNQSTFMALSRAQRATEGRKPPRLSRKPPRAARGAVAGERSDDKAGAQPDASHAAGHGDEAGECESMRRRVQKASRAVARWRLKHAQLLETVSANVA